MKHAVLSSWVAIACMDGVDECQSDVDCANVGPSMVCGYAEPGCYCFGVPRACVEDCNVGGCDAHEICGNDGLCTREACTVDDDCSESPAVCVKGRCFDTPGVCSPLAA